MSENNRLSFNLIDEPFIPCLTREGKAVEYGLRKTLLRAHELQEIRDESPLVTIALHRLLIALCHAALGDPETLDDWEGLWRGERFDEAAIDRYFDQWRDRFDLFDPDRPFYQDAELNEPLKDRDAANRLITGTQPTNTLFQHSVNPSKQQSDWDAVPPAEMVRRLIGLQTCAIQGGRGYYQMPFSKAICITPLGQNVFETLALNILPVEERDAALQPLGTPSWEFSTATYDLGPIPNGYLDFLTWQPRKVRLYPESDLMVRTVSIAPGRQLTLPDHCFEPWVAYTEGRKGAVSVGFEDSKAVWRDSHALLRFGSRDDSVNRAPAVLRLLYDLKHEGYLDRHLISLLAAGQLADNASISFTRQEGLPLPLAYLTDTDLVARLAEALVAAETIAVRLDQAINSAATELLDPTNHNPDPKRRRQFVDFLAANRLYWSRLETPFRRFFIDLAGIPADKPDARQKRLAAWVIEDCRRAALHAFDQSVGRLDRSARTLRAMQTGRDSLSRLIGAFLNQNNYWKAYHDKNEDAT